MQYQEKQEPAEKAKSPIRHEPFEIAGHAIRPGMRQTIDLPLSVLSNHTPVNLPVHVIHGRREGPTVFVSAAIHGDEIIGVEIVRRLLRASALRSLSGTLMFVPIVNSFGFINHSRYLPDRRDLNRSFPGNSTGSLASQLANLFFTEVVERCQYGIDLHSAAVNRSNLSQIRVDVSNKKARELALAFGAPIVLHSSIRDGSLRGAAAEHDVPVIVYECGEALRFDEFSVRIGVKGVLRVLNHLGMISQRRPTKLPPPSPISKRSSWIRAPKGGIFRSLRTFGDSVDDDEVVGFISDPFGEAEAEVKTEFAGLIVGRTNLPIVNLGDALFHVATIDKAEAVGVAMDNLEQAFQSDPLFDEDEIL